MSKYIRARIHLTCCLHSRAACVLVCKYLSVHEHIIYTHLNISVVVFVFVGNTCRAANRVAHVYRCSYVCCKCVCVCIHTHT
jgi:hypothetical protein